MRGRGAAPTLVFDKERTSPFTYVCRACNRCCYHKAIQVGPYEVLRLARNRSISTTEFLRTYTETGGTILRVQPDGNCVFLTEKGCGVHPDRPLVCRLYPLGRQIDADGRERFTDLPPHPESAGVYGGGETVEDYLATQAVAPYFAAAERYSALYRRMVALFESFTTGMGEEKGETRVEMTTAPNDLLSPLLDVDATVAAYCATRGLMAPENPEAIIDLHITAVEAWLNELATPPAITHSQDK